MELIILKQMEGPSNMRERQNGLAPAMALIILAILVVIVSAGAYYLLKNTGQYPSETLRTRPVDYGQPSQATSGDSGEEILVSDSDKTSDIEAELDSTSLGEFESDLDSLVLDAEPL